MGGKKWLSTIKHYNKLFHFVLDAWAERYLAFVQSSDDSLITDSKVLLANLGVISIHE